MAGFYSHAADLLDFVQLGDSIGNRPAVYFRVAHKLDAELVQAVKVEQEISRGGCRVVNPVPMIARAQRKDLVYPLLHDIVPFHTPNPTKPEIDAALARGDLWYPFILRAADWSGGKGMFLVDKASDIDPAMAEMWLLAKSGWRTIAVQWIDSCHDGWYIRHRAFVVFGKVDMWHTFVMDRWNTQAVEARSNLDQYIAANREGAEPRHLDPLAIRSGEVLGLDVFAADMVCDQAGRGYLVDINPTYVALPVPGILTGPERKRYEGHFRRVAEALKGG